MSAPLSGPRAVTGSAVTPPPGPAGTGSWQVPAVVGLLSVVMLGGALPTPLYAHYTTLLRLTPLLVTVVFAVYAAGVIGALLLGTVSDVAGRRVVIAAGMALALASCGVFAVFPTLPGLLAGRLLSGVAVGLTSGAVTAYLRELHPRPAAAALTATVTSMLGLGGGPLLSGALARFAPQPLLTSYLVLAALTLSGLVLLRLPETVARDGRRFRLRRLSVPAAARRPFAAAAVSVFAAFSVLGLLAGLTGTFLTRGLGLHDPLLTGVVACSGFAAAGLAQLVTARAHAVKATVAAMAVIPAGLALVAAAPYARSLTLFLAGAVVAAGGSGVAFRSGLAGVLPHVPAARTGELASSYYAAAYLGLGVPVIGLAALMAQVALSTATVVFAAVITGLAAAGAWNTLRLSSGGVPPPGE
ncbi:MFS transporter [Streptomyces sp. NPDC047046]|uniref:MFS transporter n=1 Tax=Streptomyces sp. NPDC047046 TaxID=3155378 RepID=UPI0033F8DE7D